MPYVASTRTGLLGVEDDQVRSAAMADVQGSLTAIGERALRTIEALEAEKARVEARAARGLRRAAHDRVPSRSRRWR